MAKTATEPSKMLTPATIIMLLCTEPTSAKITPPTAAATICGMQMVPLNKPR